MEDDKNFQLKYGLNVHNIAIETTNNPYQDFATSSHKQEHGTDRLIKIETLVENERCKETLLNNAGVNVANMNDLANIHSSSEEVDFGSVNAYDFLFIDDKSIVKDEISEIESTHNPNLNLGKQEKVFVTHTPCKVIKIEPLLESSTEKINFVVENAYDLKKVQSYSETNDFTVKIKDELLDDEPITNSAHPDKYIENYRGFNTYIVKSELEYPQDTVHCAKLLIPDYWRSNQEHNGSPEDVADPFDPPSSKKLRTSDSSLTTDNLVEVKCDITQTNSNQPNRGIKRNSTRQNNDTILYEGDGIEKHKEVLEPELSCDVCSYKTWNKEYMVLHKLTHKKEEGNSVFPCIICDYITKHKEILTKHLIEHNGKVPFRCIVCEFKCNSPSNLLKHNSNKHPEVTKPFSCNICEYKSANNSAIIRHTRIHTGEKPFACKQCSYKCTDSSSLTFHMMQHTGEKPFSCNLCPYRSKCNSTLISHMRRHTGERPFECNGCTYKFTNQSDLMQHVKINAGPEPFKCSVCEFSSLTKCALVKHVRTHTGHNTLTCEICMYKCTEKQILASHMRTHTSDGQYSCTNCDIVCVRKCDLLIHMRTHTAEKPFSCAQCDYKCRGRRTLGNHVRKTHIEPSSKKIRIRRNSSLRADNVVGVTSVITQTHSIKDKRKNTSTENNEQSNELKIMKKHKTSIEQYETKPCKDVRKEKHKEILEPQLSCDVCNYKTWNKEYMELHTLIHIENEENKVFPCIICDYVTTDKQMLLEHLIEHNGKVPFRCMVCEFKCNSPSSLLKHNISSHPEVTKPFSCNVCEYKSSNNSAIIRHTRIHTGEKPFACQQCSYKCTDSTSLTYHMKQHTSEKKYSCNPIQILVKDNS